MTRYQACTSGQPLRVQKTYVSLILVVENQITLLKTYNFKLRLLTYSCLRVAISSALDVFMACFISVKQNISAEFLFERGSLQSTIFYLHDKGSSQNIWGYMVK
jgi:hypothetical protein